jgi:hypothetical protein
MATLYQDAGAALPTFRPAADYLSIATAALERGFKVTPVSPAEKRGVLPQWNRHPSTKLSEIIQHTKDYPDYNVGVVGRRGIGNDMFIDIDADGVLEQIERETGQKMPLTFTVASRPQSAPWKRHYYFKQTEYSVKAFRTETNVKDLSVLKDGKHPTRYDLKGVGGGGLVVGAGSVRADGEVYAVISDGPVIPVPDWLVDWLCQDIHKYKSELAKARAEQSAKVKAAQLDAARTGTAVVKHDVSEDGIHDFLSSRAGSLASLGTRRSSIERMLAEQSEDFCDSGKTFADSASGKAKFHQLAFNPRLRIGNASFFRRLKPTIVGETIIMPPHIPTQKERRLNLMVETLHGFPQTLPAREGYTRLETALAGMGFVLNRKHSRHRMRVAEALKAAGFAVERAGGKTMWTRSGAASGAVVCR